MWSNGALGVRVREGVRAMRLRVGERRRAAVGVGIGVQVRLVLSVDVPFGQAVLVVEQRGGLVWTVLSGSRQRCGVVRGGGHGRGQGRKRARIQTDMAALWGLGRAVQF